MMIFNKTIKLNKIMKFKNKFNNKQLNLIKIWKQMRIMIIIVKIIIKLIIKMNKNNYKIKLINLKLSLLQLINLKTYKMKFNKKIQNQKMKKYLKVKFNLMMKLL